MKKLLIVDDEKDLIELLTEEFKSIPNLTILQASDGTTAFNMIRNDTPNLVISDYNMPGLDGAELMRRITEEKIPVPVMWISGQASPELFRKAWELGVYDLIDKPFSPSEVVSHARGLLESDDPKMLLARRPGFTKNQHFSELTVFLGNHVMADLTRRCQEEQLSYSTFISRAILGALK